MEESVLITATATTSSTITSTGPTSNKRPRPTTPRTAIAAAAAGAQSSSYNNLRDTERAARLRHPATRNVELNDLLQLSANPEVNFALANDAILLALSDIVLKECLNWSESIEHEHVDPNDVQVDDDDEGEGEDDYVVFRATGSWECPPTLQTQRFARHCCGGSTTTASNTGAAAAGEQLYELLTVIAVVLRNFSYTGANLRLLAYSPNCLYMLTAFLYVGATDERYRRFVLRKDNPNTSSSSTMTTTNTTSNSATTSNSNNNNPNANPTNNYFELPMAALITLLHLIGYIDVTGQQLVADRLFYKPDISGPPVPNPSVLFGQTLTGSWSGLGACRLARRLDNRDDVVEGLSTTQVLQIVTVPYLAAVYGLFPALRAILTDVQAARPVVVLTLDVLQKWIDAARGGLVGQVPPEPPIDLKSGDPYDLPTLRALLVHIPDAVLDRLTDLLYVPRLGNDSLEYVDPVYNMVTRVNTLRLLLNYDAVVDTDVRDRALDVLVPLLELDSPRMAIRLGKCSTNTTTNNNNNTVVVRTRLYDALIPAITTTAGRTEAAAVAAQLLRELAQAGDEARPGLEYAQQRLVQVASRDPRVSQLVWKELHPVKQKDDNHDDDNDDDDDDEEDDKDKAHGLNDSTWENGSSHENTGKGNEMVGDQKTDFEE